MVEEIATLDSARLIIAAVVGLYWVNSEARSFGLLENPVLLNIDKDKRIFTFLGQDYYIDLRILKRQF